MPDDPNSRPHFLMLSFTLAKLGRFQQGLYPEVMCIRK